MTNTHEEAPLRQVSGVALLEELEIDIRRDLLNGVTGIPIDANAWGKRVTGKDALRFAMPGTLENLGAVCEQVIGAHGRSDYEVRFSFIDDFVSVTDPVTLAGLSEEVLSLIQSSDIAELDLAPPDLIDWEHTAAFQYHTERRGNPINRGGLRLVDYVGSLAAKGL